MRKTIAIESSDDLARKLCRQIIEQIAANNFSQGELFDIQLAIEEAMINAVEHGNRQNPATQITVEYSIEPEKFEIKITDEGCGFRPDNVPDPRCDENIRNITGRGILLMRACMDSVEYNEQGNCVRMVKHRGVKKS